MQAHERIIIAVDVAEPQAARSLAGTLAGKVGAYKVGLEAVHACGLGLLDEIRDIQGSRVFYDCKLHDIPNTVAGAMHAIGRKGLWMANVHGAGGSRMIGAAVRAAADGAAEAGAVRPLVIAVTLLTSLSAQEAASEACISLPSSDYVVRIASVARAAGADGVVCSPHEIAAVRAECGPGFLIVTPGVRPAGSDQGDQRRTMTPGEAVARGADYLVIGRPITRAQDPAAAADAIAAEIARAC